MLEGRAFPNLLSEFVFTRTYSRWLDEEKRREVWPETVNRYTGYIFQGRNVPEELPEQARKLILGLDVMPSMRALWCAGPTMDRDNVCAYNCMGEETEFITRQGVRRFSDFQDGARVTVLTHTGAWKPAVVRSYGQQQLFNITLVRGRSEYKVRATRNHQWLLEDGSRTGEIRLKDRLMRPPRIVADWDYYSSNPEARNYWAFGYVYGDGTLVKNKDGEYTHSMVRLCGEDKARFLDRFQELGYSTSSPPTFGGDAMAYTGHYLKALPSVESDGFENVVAFVRGYLDADGHKNTNGVWPNPFSGIQASKESSIEFIRRVFPTVGAYITQEVDLTGEQTNYGVRPKTSKFGLVLGFGDSENSTFSVKDIQESSVETVWCLEVEDDHSFVLPNGIVTGNCSFLPLDNLRAFGEALYILMNGTGVGFSVERTFINNLPVVLPYTGEAIDYLIQDSTEGWADAVYFGMVQGHLGRKINWNYSRIRPKGSRLKTKGGRASGPEPLKRVLDFIGKTARGAAGRHLKSIEAHDIMCMIAEIVMVGGFRRASLISFSDVDDPDMREAKDWSKGNFPEIRYMANNSAVYHGRPTREVFDREWDALRLSGSGERGFYIVSGPNMAKRGGEYRANPCVTGDTRVMTDRGMVQIQDLVGKPTGLVLDCRFGSDGFGRTTDVGAFKTGTKEVFRLTTDEGYSLRLTADHRVMTARGWVAAQDLKPSDRVHITNQGGAFGTKGDENLGMLAGWLTGDGCVLENGTPRFYFYGEKRGLSARMKDAAQAITGESLASSQYEAADRDHFQSPGLREYLGGMDKGHVPEFVWQGTKDCQRGYLSSLFTADGGVQGTRDKGASIRLSASVESLLRDVQKLLLNFGVASKLYLNRRDAGMRMLPDGKGGTAPYPCQADHELVISKASLVKYQQNVGFLLASKTDKLNAIVDGFTKGPYAERFTARVVSVEACGTEDVYDLTEPTTHSFVADGVVVHNCGEIRLRFRRALDPWTGRGGGGQFCVAGDTPLVTREGITTIRDAVGKPVHVWNGQKWSKVTPFQTGIAQKLYRVQFSDGSFLDTTEYHRFSVSHRNTRGTKTPWREMTVGEIRAAGVGKRWATEPFQIVQEAGEIVDPGHAYTAGAAVGDGWIRQTSGGGHPNPRVYTGLWGQKDSVMPVVGVRGTPHVANVGNTALMMTTVFCPDQDPEFIQAVKNGAAALDPLFRWSRNAILHFLAGWLDADGSGMGKGGVRLYVSDEARARKVQLLLTRCGIRSTIRLFQAAGTQTNYGSRTRDLWYVDITDCADIPCHRLNTSDGHVPLCKSKYQTIRAIEELPGLHPTFCFEEPERHMGVFGNTLTYQCNLVAAVMRSWDTLETMVEKVRVATWLGMAQASYTNFPYLRPAWKELSEEDRLLGVDITGQCDNPALSGDNEVMLHLNRVARETAMEASKALGVNYPAAITCGKPSGNSSQFVDCASGFHTRYAEFYFRHVRISSKDPLFKLIRDQGVPVYPENGQEHLPEDKVDVWVARFPVKAPEGAMLRKHERALDQCHRYLKIMRTWCGEKGHNQSATIYVREHEWKEVGEWLWENFDEVVGLSFLPYEEGGTKYRLAPYVEISEAEYEDALRTMPQVDFSVLSIYETMDEGQGAQEVACVAGACLF
jgi:hypothetical protein